MKTLGRRIGRWVLIVLLAATALFALQLTVLAVPQLFLHHHIQAGTVTIYYDSPIDATIDSLASDVNRRLRGSGFYDSSRADRAYFFSSHVLYSRFARLALQPSQVQGFALPILGNSFVSGPRVRELSETSGDVPRYSIWEGSPAHTIAHEIGHLYLTDLIGRAGWDRLPHWKQEGFPEYVANIAVIRQDSLASLPQRFAILNDHRRWGWVQRWDRIHFEAGLLVEFLCDIQQHSVGQILADSVTKETTREALRVWVEEQAPRPVASEPSSRIGNELRAPPDSIFHGDSQE